MKVITTAKAQWTKELANASVFNENYNIDQGTETDHNEFHLVLTEDEDYPIQLFFRLNTEYFCYGYPASKCCSTLEDFLRSDYVVKALMFYYMENDHDLKDSIELADWYKNRIHEVAPFDLEDLKQACIKDEHYHNYDDIEEEVEEKDLIDNATKKFKEVTMHLKGKTLQDVLDNCNVIRYNIDYEAGLKLMDIDFPFGVVTIAYRGQKLVYAQNYVNVYYGSSCYRRQLTSNPVFLEKKELPAKTKEFMEDINVKLSGIRTKLACEIENLFCLGYNIDMEHYQSKCFAYLDRFGSSPYDEGDVFKLGFNDEGDLSVMFIPKGREFPEWACPLNLVSELSLFDVLLSMR